MEIIVVNPFVSTEPHFEEIGLITAYKSVLWNIQLYGLGYFQLVVPPTAENLTWLKTGRFLCRADDVERFGSSAYYNNAMVIRNVTIEWNPDDGYMMTVTGRMIKDILNQRCIWNQISKENVALNSLIGYDIMIQNVVDPRGYAQGIVDEIEDEKEDAEDDYTQAVEDRQNAYAAWQRAIDDFGPDSSQAQAAKEVYDAYVIAEEEALEAYNKVVDRWNKAIYNRSEQLGREIPYTSAGVIDMQNPPRIDVQLHGEQIGDYIASVCEEHHFGWKVILSENDFSLGFVVGTDRSSSVIFSPEYDNLRNSTYTYSTDDYFNGAQVGGEGEGIDQVKVNIGNEEGIDRFEIYIDASALSQNKEAEEEDPDAVISLETYRKMLRQYGKTELQQYNQRRHFSGEIDPNGMFKIGTHYFLGDTVKFEDGVVSSKARLIEIIYSDEEDGFTTTATFEEVNTANSTSGSSSGGSSGDDDEEPFEWE